MVSSIANQYYVKGYCQTSTKLVYTTLNGIKAVSLVGLTQVPSDYDYAVNSFDYLGSMNGTQTIPSRFSFTLTANSSIALAFNTMLQFTCYDGVSWATDPYNLGFGNGPNTGSISRTNPFIFAGIGVSLISYVGPLATTAPVVQSYAVASTISALNNTTIDVYTNSIINVGNNI